MQDPGLEPAQNAGQRRGGPHLPRAGEQQRDQVHIRRDVRPHQRHQRRRADPALAESLPVEPAQQREDILLYSTALQRIDEMHQMERIPGH